MQGPTADGAVVRHVAARGEIFAGGFRPSPSLIATEKRGLDYPDWPFTATTNGRRTRW